MFNENQKKYFHNSEMFLKKFFILFPKYTKTNNPDVWHAQDDSPKNYYIKNNKKFYLNSCTSVYNYTFRDERIYISNSTNDLSGQELHLQRKKNKCLIVLGNELSYGDKNLTLEDRLEKSFATQCAEKLDSDLFLSTFKNIDNTSLFIRLVDILLLLKKNNYKEIKIIFQLSDCSRCFKSEFWASYYPFERPKSHQVLNSHLSYHFLSPNQIFDLFNNSNFYQKKNFILNFKDSNMFSLNIYKFSFLEFLEFYESLFDELLTNLSKKFSDYFDVKHIIWKDYHPVLHKNIIQKNLLELMQEQNFDVDKKVDLPYVFDTHWFQSFLDSNIIENEIKKYLNVERSNNKIDDWKLLLEIYKHYQSPFNSDLEQDIIKEKIKIKKFYNKFTKEKLETFDQTIWSDYLLAQSGWIK